MDASSLTAVVIVVIPIIIGIVILILGIRDRKKLSKLKQMRDVSRDLLSKDISQDDLINSFMEAFSCYDSVEKSDNKKE